MESFSIEEMSEKLLSCCSEVLTETLQDSSMKNSLDELAKTSGILEKFVRGLTLIDEPNISSDDEILNWTFSEAIIDLWGAVWLLGSGFYKLSASSLRNALDISIAALYFQIRENTDSVNGGYNKFYQEWDSGLRQTPSWGEMKPFISKQPSVKIFNENNNLDIVEEVYIHFKYLCSYTHTSSYAKNGDPTSVRNSTGVQPIFDKVSFDKGVVLSSKTMSLIATIWQVSFPKIISTNPLGLFPNSDYDCLFSGSLGTLAVSHR